MEDGSKGGDRTRARPVSRRGSSDTQSKPRIPTGRELVVLFPVSGPLCCCAMQSVLYCLRVSERAEAIRIGHEFRKT